MLAEAERLTGLGSWEWRVRDDRVLWSDNLYRILGLEPNSYEATFDAYMERVHPDDYAWVQNAVETAIRERRPFAFHHRIVRGDGQGRAVRCHGEPSFSAETGGLERVFGTCQEIDLPVPVARPQAATESQHRCAFENAPLGIATVGFDAAGEGRIVEANPELCELVGRSEHDLIGSALASLCAEEDAALDSRLRRRLVAGEISRYSIEKRATLGGGRPGWLRLDVASTPSLPGGSAGGVVLVQDVTERKQFEDQLRHVADHDALTGLFNRRRFHEELESQLMLMRRHHEPATLLLADVDHLKAVNDNEGHAAGDIALKRIAEAIQLRLRSTDIIGRISGDEFAMVLRHCAPEEAMSLSADLIARLGREQIGARTLSISIGVVRLPEAGQLSAGDAMAIADAAMYRAKRRGGGVTELADIPEGQPDQPAEREGGLARPASPATPRLTLAQRVRSALVEGRLLVYAQPVVDLTTGHTAHHELLVRLRDDSGEVLAAADFLGAATREPGLCAEIDRWMTGRATELLGDEYRGERVQVNLAGESVTDDGAIGRISELVRSSNIESGSLAFELAEGSVARDIDRAVATVEELARVGCPVALDGFSGEFGAFGYLERLKVDQIKLAGTLVQGLAGAEGDRATTEAIVRVARGTNRTTVATLVDSEPMMVAPRALGIDMVQGNLIAAPAPAGALSRAPRGRALSS